MRKLLLVDLEFVGNVVACVVQVASIDVHCLVSKISKTSVVQRLCNFQNDCLVCLVRKEVEGGVCQRWGQPKTVVQPFNNAEQSEHHAIKVTAHFMRVGLGSVCRY